MDTYRRHKLIYRLLADLLSPVIRARFNMSTEELHIDGPFLLVSNHVTSWDPLLVGICLGHRQAYFVASEHLFRIGLLTKPSTGCLLRSPVAKLPPVWTP